MQNFLAKESSQQLKGLAILLVVVGHLNLFLKFLPSNLIFAGSWGVAIFLILSGYGLTQSYLKNGLAGDFFSKRFSKVLFPYSVVTVIWLIIDVFILKINYSWKTILLSVIGLDFNRTLDPSMWYVTFILIWYLIFYLVFKLKTWDLLKLVLLFVFSYYLKYYSASELTQNSVYQWQLHAYLFPLGVMLGLYANKIVSLLQNGKIHFVLALISILGFYLFSINVGRSAESIDLYSWANLMFAVGLISLYLILQHYQFKSESLMFIGAISYELYLLEWVFMTKYSILKVSDNPGFSLGIYFVAIIILGIGLKNLLSYPNNLLGVLKKGITKKKAE